MPVEQSFSEPLVFAPTAVHTHTIILLHGRGSKAAIYVQELASLQQAFPHAKLIFPQARKQRATVYKKSITRQWFDDWHLSSDLQSTDVVHMRYDEGLQTSGLGETVLYLHGLIRAEALLVGGARKVVVGGFSQGAAASLVAALLWNGSERLGGVVAMSGWLPYLRQMTEMLEVGEDGGSGDQGMPVEEEDLDNFDPFDRAACPGETGRGSGGVEAALGWLREEIDMPADGDHRLQSTPFLFCHGLNDRKVEPDRSQDASEFLARMGMKSVERKCHTGHAHEVSGLMLDDVVGFLQSVSS